MIDIEVSKIVFQDALAKAAGVLERLSFTRIEERLWTGSIQVKNYGEISIEVAVPAHFPYQLPDIYIDPISLPKRIPHLDKDGKVCIAPNTGVLLDVSNVEGLITDSIDRAVKVFSEGLLKGNEQDFIEEFGAYWNEGARFFAVSIVSPNEVAREICLARIFVTRSRGKESLIADSRAAARLWLSNVAWVLEDFGPAFYLPLSEHIEPPNFREILTVKTFFSTFEARTSPASFSAFQKWLDKVKLPAVLAFSFPLSVGRVVGAIQVPKSIDRDEGKSKSHAFPMAGLDRTRAFAGFRKENVKASHELRFCLGYAAGRYNVQRADPIYLTSRGGAMEQLAGKTVVVVGCGAVGSHTAIRLASTGISALRLVDNETLSADNIYRHELGMEDINEGKAIALKRRLESRFPSLVIKANEAKIEDLLEKDPSFVLKSDLVVIALGDETLERRLNSQFPKMLPRIHAWLEPLGIGGHALVAGVGDGTGCYNCLFNYKEHQGQSILCNASSLAEVGQIFQKSVAGCSGIFTPFSGLDADQTALYVARAATKVLTSQLSRSQLITWIGDFTEFMKQGFKPSERARQMAGKPLVVREDFSRRDCPVCAK